MQRTEDAVASVTEKKVGVLAHNLSINPFDFAVAELIETFQLKRKNALVGQRTDRADPRRLQMLAQQHAEHCRHGRAALLLVGQRDTRI